MSNFHFEIIAKQDQARCSIIATPNGIIETPAFIFCATKAAIKGLTPQQMRDCGTQIILGNTYHLMLQPGEQVLAKSGGLAKFTGWNGPTLTDSGGFQIFSLGYGSVANEIKGKRKLPALKTLVKIDENGAIFKSYIDGSKWILTPEKSIQVQRAIGADLILVLDECTPFHVDHDYTAKSMEMSHRWELRSLQEFNRSDTGKQKLYGIIQGGIHEDLRQMSADFVNSNDFFGHAIGGSLGQNKEQMHHIVSFTAQKLSDDRPIHLLGIGGVSDIFNGVRAGIDTFDCVHPTRIARHGGALVQRSKLNNDLGLKKDHINILNAGFKYDQDPIELECGCYTCTNFSRSYLHHLFKAKEILGMNLLMIHNVYLMNKLMGQIRKAIKNNKLNDLEKEWIV